MEKKKGLFSKLTPKKKTAPPAPGPVSSVESSIVSSPSINPSIIPSVPSIRTPTKASTSSVNKRQHDTPVFTFRPKDQQSCAIIDYPDDPPISSDAEERFEKDPHVNPAGNLLL